MRVEPYTTGSIIHVVKRGARGMNIVEDNADKRRFVTSLFLLNDVFSSRNWHRETAELPLFKRPEDWPKRQTITEVLAWTLMPNHFHLLLREKKEGGSAKFIQRLCGSMSLCFNLKYDSKGSIFQGSYKAKVVNEDSYLRYLIFYIHIKNVLELYPGGLISVLKNFNQAWDWALKYNFSSFSDYVFDKNSPILDDSESLISEIHKEDLSKRDVYEILKLYVGKSDEWSGRIKDLAFE